MMDFLAQTKHQKMDMRFGIWKCYEPLQDNKLVLQVCDDGVLLNKSIKWTLSIIPGFI
jgi:hypothetical protein